MEFAGIEASGDIKKVPEFSEVRTLREEKRTFKVRLPEINFAEHTVLPEVCLGPRDAGLEI